MIIRSTGLPQVTELPTDAPTDNGPRFVQFEDSNTFGYWDGADWNTLTLGTPGIDDVLAIGQILTGGRSINLGGNSLEIGTNNSMFNINDSGIISLGDIYNNTNGTKITVDDAAQTITASKDVTVPDEAYGIGWNGSLEVPTKNAVYDKIETLASIAPSKIYKAIIAQSGTGLPTATILLNTLGEVPTFVRNNIGDYELNTVAGIFLTNKTLVHATISTGS